MKNCARLINLRSTHDIENVRDCSSIEISGFILRDVHDLHDFKIEKLRTKTTMISITCKRTGRSIVIREEDGSSIMRAAIELRS